MRKSLLLVAAPIVPGLDGFAEAKPIKCLRGGMMGFASLYPSYQVLHFIPVQLA